MQFTCFNMLNFKRQIQFTFTRERRYFGCPVFFEDRLDDAKDATIDCFSFEDTSYNIVKKELDVGVQVRLHYYFYSYKYFFIITF